MQHLCSALRGVGIGVLAYDGGECIVYCRSSWVICEDSLQFTYRVGVRLRPGGCIQLEESELKVFYLSLAPGTDRWPYPDEDGRAERAEIPTWNEARQG